MPEETTHTPGPKGRLLVFLLAAALAALAYAFPLPGISEEGRRLTSVMMVVATLWIAEAIPLSVTALLGPSLAVFVGVASAKEAFAAFGNPIILLFVGSFLLARATFKYKLNERIAYRILSLGILKDDPTRAFIFLGLTTAFLSAWMSNTATTAMMLPIAQSVLLAMVPEKEGAQVPRIYAAGLMLIVAYSASLGGLFTPIGTPPNLIGLALIEQATGTRVSFPAWIGQVFPVALAALVVMMAYFSFLFRDEKKNLTYQRSQMVARYKGLGAWKSVERRVVIALLVTVTLWMTPPLLRILFESLGYEGIGKFLRTRLPEAVVPILVAGALFWMRREKRDGAPPILEVEDLSRIDWPVIVLFGGGMCLGDLMIQTGMARALGGALSSYLPVTSAPILVLVFCILAIFVSETTSNTASANMVIPVVVAVAAQVGTDPIALGIAATVACTFGFMLPVSTPTNAMAYSTGFVTQREMIRYGVVLDLVGAVLLFLWFGVMLG